MRARDIIISWLCVRNECSERIDYRFQFFLLIIAIPGAQRGARRPPRRQFSLFVLTCIRVRGSDAQARMGDIRNDVS